MMEESRSLLILQPKVRRNVHVVEIARGFTSSYDIYSGFNFILSSSTIFVFDSSSVETEIILPEPEITVDRVFFLKSKTSSSDVSDSHGYSWNVCIFGKEQIYLR